MSTTDLLSPAAYARRRGVSRTAVSQAIAAGRISVIRNESGKKLIDPEVADIQWEKNTNPAQAARANTRKQTAASSRDEQQGSAYWEAHTRREIAAANREEMLEKKLAGELVDRVRVESAAFGIARMLRDTVLGLPTQIAPELASMTDAFAIEVRMRDALRQVFADFVKLTAADLDRAMGPGPGDGQNPA